MSVLLGLLSRDVMRSAACVASVIGLEKPPSSEFMPYSGYSTPMGWNSIARRLLASKHEYLFTMNDDHIYPADAITRLMAHKVECVTGLYLLKQFPFEPVAYDYVNDEGKMGHYYLQDGVTGLIPIKRCGDGALLTHRSVFEKIPEPWYQLNGPPAPLDQINCDVLFCKKLLEYGVQIWCDLDVRVGHVQQMPIYPHYDGGKWSVLLPQGDGNSLCMPPAQAGTRQALEAQLERQRQLAEVK